MAYVNIQLSTCWIEGYYDEKKILPHWLVIKVLKKRGVQKKLPEQIAAL